VDVGVNTTLELLSQVPSKLAEDVLVSALDSPCHEIQIGVCKTLLARKGNQGHREVISRLHKFGEELRSNIESRSGRMSSVLREGMLGQNEQTFTNTLLAVKWMREYDQIATLLKVVQGSGQDRASKGVETCTELVDMLYEEISTPRDYSIRRDPQLARARVVTLLEEAAQKYILYQRPELIEAFLLLVARENVTFQNILRDAGHPAHDAVIDRLLHSQAAGIIHLLIGCLGSSTIPTSLLTVVGQRQDRPFIRRLTSHVSERLSAEALKNLQKIGNLSWLNGDWDFLSQLNGSQQAGVLTLATATRMRKSRRLDLLARLLSSNEVEGRRHAIATLVDMTGMGANHLCVIALEDSDPYVVATAAAQLRSRDIPGAMNRLLDLAGSEHEVVNQAVRDSLSEFSAERYITTYDSLEEEARQRTGRLVLRIDPRLTALLQEELLAPTRGVRIRALHIIRTLDLSNALETTLLDMTQDKDSFIRAEVVETLAGSASKQVLKTLRELLEDRSEMVQEAAERALRLRKDMAECHVKGSGI